MTLYSFVRPVHTLALSSLLALTACGSAGFNGEKKDKANTGSGSLTGSSADLEKQAGQSTVKGGDVEITPPTEQEKSDIQKCAKAWGQEPPTSFEVVRKIKASVSVGSSGVTLRDEANTSGPVLTLLYAGVNVGGTPTWELLNPKGWYCIVVNVNVGTKLTVKISKDAKLADSKVAVNVGSQVDGTTAAVGVNVGSEITVEKL